MSDETKSTPTTTADAPTSAAEPTPYPEVDAISAENPPPPEPAAILQPPSGPEKTQAPEPTPTTKLERSDEPQNALTRKFSEKEWKALKEFRAQLPDIFEEAFTEKAEAKTTPITLWNVTVHPTEFEDARVSVVLMKFLRARNLNPSAARDMMVSTLRWRDIFKPEDTLKEEFPQDIFGQLGHVFGKDKQGRPITYNIYGGSNNLTAVFSDIPRFLRWRVSLMEKGIALLDFENVDQLLQVHDYEGVKSSDRTQESKNAASEATSIFSGHYPEFLHRKFIVNVPMYLSWIFWIFKPILPSQTFAKMSVVGTGAHAIGRAILPYVDENELPEKYGGEARAW